jgi:putative solute:sodium symporter small subunit
MAGYNQGRYWFRTGRLMCLIMALWAFFGLLVPIFVKPLDTFSVLGIPLGYFMTAQGSLIAFVAIVFFFVRRQDVIDREEGVAEEL